MARCYCPDVALDVAPRVIILLAALLSAAPAVRADEPAGRPPLLERLQAKLETVTSLKGRFIQRLDAPALGRQRTERGTFSIKRPDRMRWEYEKPERKLAVTDGVTTWLYVPEDYEAHAGRPDDLAGGGAMMLLAGRLRLSEDFSARGLSSEEAGPQGFAGAEVLELTPRRGGEEFEKLVVAVDPESLQMRRLTVVDAVGDRMIFDFFDLVENPDIDDALFTFEPPPGTEVIDER